MNVVASFPREVVVHENVFIPMSDGKRLAARIWLPADAEARPVPAILEYLPYRKADRMRDRDEPMHRYFAGHGYAAIRADVRGTGDSEGLLLDEYHLREIEDGVEILSWIASQPWCSGAVGMMGISWGGFNALQIAARRPPELAAVVSVCASDDRYEDDAHYMGGCLLNENFVWGAALFTLSALPPDPEVWGEEWRELWMARLEGASLFPEHWLRHPHRDEYWKHGSVRGDYEAIACPVYAVGGWADAYTNAVPRLLEGLRVPRKGLIGPWAHSYPHLAPESPIGFLQEVRRWWDHWLLGIDTAIMDEPLLRVFMPEPAGEGRWVSESEWPTSRIQPRPCFLGSGRLESEPEEADASVVIDSPLSTGTAGGSWCPFASPEEMAGDQGEDDERSVVFDSAPLEERIEILGAPELRLPLACDRPAGILAARLVDVFPGGASSRVTYALLDLTHRDGHEHPSPLVPGAVHEITLRFNHAAYAFLPGHRLRLALSTAYWPIAWPAREKSRLTLFPRESRLTLPQRPPRAEDRELAAFEGPESAPALETTELQRGSMTMTVSRDPATGEVRYRVASDLTEGRGPALTRIEETGMEHGHSAIEEFEIQDFDPLSARTALRHHVLFRRGGFSAAVETAMRIGCDADDFHLEAELEGFEGDRSVFRRTWRVSVPREG